MIGILLDILKECFINSFVKYVANDLFVCTILYDSTK